MKRSYFSLEDKIGIEESDVQFQGFDGNSNIESRYMGFSRFLLSQEKFEDVLRRGDLNSHMPSLDMYRRMLKEWMQSNNKHNLNKEDLIRIIDARTHPSNRKN